VLRLILKRIALSIPLLLIVSLVTFVLESLTPGDAARLILGQDYSPAAYARLRVELGLNHPLYQQYWDWLVGVVHGNLGISPINKTPVAQTLLSRLPVTLSLVGGTVIVSAIIGVALGIASALRGGVLGRAVDAISLLGFAIPNFWLGLLLASLFGVTLKLLPVTGYTPLTTNPGLWALGLILPVATLAAGAVAGIAKLTRDSMSDVMDREFIRALRAKGVSEVTIVFRHALRSAALPVVTALGLLFIGLLSGTVLVEDIFALPGLGSAALTATNGHDFPTLQGVVLFFTLMVIVINLIIDIAYGWLNPRVRQS
jgi:peptide/nickel transport system permease protein